MWRWVVSFTPLSLYRRGKSPRYTFDRRLGGPRAGLDAAEKTKILHCRESNPGRPACRYTDWVIPAPRTNNNNNYKYILFVWIIYWAQILSILNLWDITSKFRIVRMLQIADLQHCHTWCVIYRHTKLHTPSSNSWLVIAVKWTVRKKLFAQPPYCYFTVYQTTSTVSWRPITIYNLKVLNQVALLSLQPH
jgi:hypothetical protein